MWLSESCQMTKTNRPTLSEIEETLRFLWSAEKAHTVVQGLRATEKENERLREDNRQLEGMLNVMNNCGDVTRVLERTF